MNQDAHSDAATWEVIYRVLVMIDRALMSLIRHLECRFGWGPMRRKADRP